ncbi:uncharacterized protein LOC127122066 [Lathyrus oleraceus]|uniref:uncharacterized protein LOC127122066 n=1 Tax=Pisum sativum TaxID=3888 RepID=UPI0021D337FE|nr:uncharacterized protein LOC127122066 [Pisum sativum]
MAVTEYTSMFKELVKFFPYCNGAAVEGSKCIKFENRLCPKIKQGIGYHEIRRFPTLVIKCRINDEDIKDRSAYYNSISERKGKNQYCGKSYSTPADKGKQRISDDKKPSEGDTPAFVKWFKCGELGHRANECKNNIMKCFKCGKTCHILHISRVLG